MVDELGGLPPVKIHCSVLAVDGFLEALHNYLTKNQKPIPDKLKERHSQIEKEKKQIEERYKDWSQIEEELHKEDEEDFSSNDS